MQQVGKVEQEVAQLRLDLVQCCFLPLRLVADAGDLGKQRRRVFALALGGADLLRQRVAPRLQFLRARLDVLAVALERLEARRVEHDAAPRETRGNRGQIISKQLMSSIPQCYQMRGASRVARRQDSPSRDALSRLFSHSSLSRIFASSPRSVGSYHVTSGMSSGR